jgi:membrane fusion protein, adhesin transport system
MTAATLDGVIHHRRARAGSIVLWLVVAALGILLYWASVSSVDQVARAPGTVIASSRVQVIQSVDGGVLQTLAVAEGDRVKAGQVLARFDPVRPRSEHAAADSKQAALTAALARLKAEASGQEPVYPAAARRHPDLIAVQNALLAGRRANLKADLASLQSLVDVAEQELAITERLVKDGDSSQLELLRSRRQAAEARGKLESRRNQYLQDVSSEMARIHDELEQAEQQATQRLRQLDNVVVSAPMDGIVKNVRFTTLGAVLRPGDELMTIVPVDDRMIVEAKVAPRDIALIQTGLAASIRFDAYDSTAFGAVEGRVTHVSADSIREEGRGDGQSPSTYYRVHVVTDSPAITRTGRSIEVIPGMTATVDVRTGDRSLLEYLLKPLHKVSSEAFGER